MLSVSYVVRYICCQFRMLSDTYVDRYIIGYASVHIQNMSFFLNLKRWCSVEHYVVKLIEKKAGHFFKPLYNVLCFFTANNCTSKLQTARLILNIRHAKVNCLYALNRLVLKVCVSKGFHSRTSLSVRTLMQMINRSSFTCLLFFSTVFTNKSQTNRNCHYVYTPLHIL